MLPDQGGQGAAAVPQPPPPPPPPQQPQHEQQHQQHEQQQLSLAPEDDGAAGDSSPLYNKFQMEGHQGAFASMGDYLGGLHELIGAPTLDSAEPMAQPHNAMEAEHCSVRSGFGESDHRFGEFDSAGTVTTPRHEWLHVVHPNIAPALFTASAAAAAVGAQAAAAAGSMSGSAALEVRPKIPLAEFTDRDKMREKLLGSFASIGWDTTKLRLEHWPETLQDLDIRDAELIAARLYTGPAFVLYNTVLRSAGQSDQGLVQRGQFKGENTRPLRDKPARFGTTIHNINHACMKLSRLSGELEVHRGLAGTKLPPSMLKQGYKVGVEYAFMVRCTTILLGNGWPAISPCFGGCGGLSA